MTENISILFGYGKMGLIHLDALLSARRADPSIDIVVVEPDDERRAAAEAKLEAAGIDPATHSFATGEAALDNWQPTIAVMACYDREHAPMMQLLKHRAPTLRALFTEKPLTEHQAQAEGFMPWLQQLELVTMNTVIHFSPIFPKFHELQQPRGLLDGWTLTGAEGAWMNDYSRDNRPLIGVRGDALHPLGVACEMLGIGPATMESGKGVYGVLNPDAPQVMTIVHELSDSTWFGNESCIPLRLRSSYSGDLSGPDLERRVIGFYQKGQEKRAVEFNFDTVAGGRKFDTLQVYDLGYGKNPEQIFAFTGNEADIDMGLAAPDSIRDKARAFVGQSLRALFHPEQPDNRKYLSLLEDALAIQTAVEVINPGRAELMLTPLSAAENVDRLANARRAGHIHELVGFGEPIAERTAYSVARSQFWITRHSLWRTTSGHVPDPQFQHYDL